MDMTKAWRGPSTGKQNVRQQGRDLCPKVLDLVLSLSPFRIKYVFAVNGVSEDKRPHSSIVAPISGISRAEQGNKQKLAEHAFGSSAMFVWALDDVRWPIYSEDALCRSASLSICLHPLHVLHLHLALRIADPIRHFETHLLTSELLISIAVLIRPVAAQAIFTGGAMSAAKSLLESLFPHLCLVDPLPSRPEDNAREIDDGLCARLSQATQHLRAEIIDSSKDLQFWESIQGDLGRIRQLHKDAFLDQQELRTAFAELSIGDFLLLHIAKQNAGLSIQRKLKKHQDVVIFESFEVSARSEPTLASDAYLRRQFPGLGVEVPFESFISPDFQKEATSFIERASIQAVAQMVPKTWKAGVATGEIRDTTDPALITDVFMGVLETVGHRVSTPQLQKNVWDCVLWEDGTKVPWRRSAFWLALRVGLQRRLYDHYGPQQGYVHYKTLMCVVLRQFLNEARHALHPTLVQALIGKLGRRLSKLERSLDSLTGDALVLRETLPHKLEQHFTESITLANLQIAERYSATHAASVRRIRPIVGRPPEADCKLTLTNSEDHLRRVLRPPYDYTSIHRSNADFSAASLKDYSSFSSKYRRLADIEDQLRTLAQDGGAGEDPNKACEHLASRIAKYLTDVGLWYDADPLQTSHMLLTLMELWVAMDKAATEVFPLLMKFAPGFPTEVLSKLQLPLLKDLKRIQAIEKHLAERHRLCNTNVTIFADPQEGCFAEQWFDYASNSAQIRQFRLDLETQDTRLRDDKRTEYEKLMVEYRAGWELYLETDCNGLLTEVVNKNSGEVERKHVWKTCPKHTAASRFMFLALDIHEHMLPNNESHLKSLLAEYYLPSSLLSYRDTTWQLISRLGRNTYTSRPKKEVSTLAWDYGRLAAFASPRSRAVTLGSLTKSFDQTHYKLYKASEQGLPRFSTICKPNGMRLRYCLGESGEVLDANDLHVSFDHLFVITFPPTSPFASLQYSGEYDFDGDGPSSNQTIAAQTKCPSGLSPHEFKAFLALASGYERRWLEILVAMCSNDINFSTEAVAHLLTRQVLQIGPRGDGHVLRVCSHIFQDRSFCNRLLQQLQSRVSNAAANWRETTAMDLLLTIALRLYSLSTVEGVQTETLRLIYDLRRITWKWVKVLRDNNLMADSASSAMTFQKYGRAAALICRRTFACHLENDLPLKAEALQCFLETSIALQDNLPSRKEQWQPKLRQRLVQDVKLAQRLRNKVRLAIQLDASAAIHAIAGYWPAFSNLKDSSTWDMQFSPQDDTGVVINMLSPLSSAQQTFAFNWLEGHLLVNGYPVGSLPAEYRGHPVLNELFGEQILRTFPSEMPGMSYMLAVAPEGNQVHVGFRNRQLIVRTCLEGSVKELVDREVFRGTQMAPDLPWYMIDKCTHWLDVRSGVLEIRRHPDFWHARPGNWELDVSKKQAQRRNVLLIDPTFRPDMRSFAKSSFDTIARMFQSFEYPRYITVWRGSSGALHVKLDRLDLTFFVKHGTLICEELQAEMDNDQDAGTWYGLESMLVMKSVRNPRQRSVLVPLGVVTCEPRGQHARVKIEPNGAHCRYIINEELGRLDSPSEPSLLYLKALLHAYTSRAIPDRLTGRTGTEEALQFLRSGICHPYHPLNPPSVALLDQIADLSPMREWYPDDLKVLEKVMWSPKLLAANQDEAFRNAVAGIRQESHRLFQFHSNEKGAEPAHQKSDSHLAKRALQRRRRYQSHGFCDSTGSHHPARQLRSDYDARDTAHAHPARTNMLGVLGILHTWPSAVANTNNLAGLLNDAPCIEGFGCAFIGNIIDDCLTADLVLKFGPLIQRCRDANAGEKVELMFLFAMLSYQRGVAPELLRLFVSFAIFEDLKAIQPPAPDLFSSFVDRNNPRPGELAAVIETCAPKYVEPSNEDPNALKYLPQRRARAEREKLYQQGVHKSALSLASHILKHWPSANVDMSTFTEETAIDPYDALSKAKPILQGLVDNLQLSAFVHETMLVLQHKTQPQVSLTARPSPVIAARMHPTMRQSFQPVTLGQLCTKMTTVPSTAEHGEARLQPRAAPLQMCTLSSRTELLKLENIVRPLKLQGSKMRLDYANDLLGSIRALARLPDSNRDTEVLGSLTSLELEIREARQHVKDYEALLVSALESGDSALSWLGRTGMLPRMTTTTLLEQLQSVRQVQFGKGMKEGLVAYGIALTTLQRLLRIEDALIRGQDERRKAEINNTGHENWSPLQAPDWLLLEIETNILMRPQQVEVARATISPQSSANSLLQLQMGQGKSLCIVPAVAAVLADKQRLARVIVPRPLLSQTVRELQRRLGGLIGRRVSHVPFSRQTPTAVPVIREYHSLHSEIMEHGGIVVAIPEHLLSFKLSGQQRLADAAIAEATQMIKTQRWLQDNCRDILDESDHILSPKIQLIYPGGAQMAVDGSPQRWETAQTLFHLVAGHLDDLKLRFRLSIEVAERLGGGLPFVYFLRKDVEKALVELLVKDAERGAIPLLTLSQFPASDRLAIVEFISKPTVQKQALDSVERLFKDNEAALHVIYFLRGCLVHRLLLLTLKRRFHVHYGMHPTRPGLSVPYQYKGVPSDTAEWGHPDVAILFTCLSFYYQGLSEAQLRQSLQIVAKSDNPTAEYEHWVHYSKSMPQSLKDWNGINIDDAVQMAEIHRHVKFSMPAANHFLNAFIFPKYAKQFSTKLHASAWDIPLFSSRSHVSQSSIAHLTTGFSGTTDGKYLFPLNIRQREQTTLAHTDAEVLAFLLAKRNQTYYVTSKDNKRLNEVEFLRRLNWQKIRILIDAGAQIMEMDNVSLIKAWMKVDHSAKAGVYFNAENVLTVMHRKGKMVPFSASPFAEDLSECLVYFAQANCRGSDVPLPLTAHAALTLSLGQTKDATVQAAMRLRQLGTTQSLTWFATPEVDQSIRDHLKARKILGNIDSAKVISWLLQQTCEGIEALTPLCYGQGKNFCERMQAEMDNVSFLTSKSQRDSFLNVLRQPERQTLKQFYFPRSKRQAEVPLTGLGSKLTPIMNELIALKKSFDHQCGSAVHATALEEVEVEREYAYEVERIREVQKAVHFRPLDFGGLHPNLKAFVRSGRLPIQSTAADLAFTALKWTGPGQKYGINSAAISSRLFASTEFSKTVEIPEGQSGDNFLRQPKYVLYSQVSDVAILVSPEEAELLLKLLRTFANPLAHILTFAAPVTRRMLIFNDLQFFNFPAMPASWSAPLWLKTELGLFAGKLYFSWNEYDRLAELLGLHNSAEETDASLAISEKPISFVQDLLDLRRKGQDFYNTPIGYITQGKKLERTHAFFTLEDHASTTTSSEGPDDETCASDISDEKVEIKDNAVDDDNEITDKGERGR